MAEITPAARAGPTLAAFGRALVLLAAATVVALTAASLVVLGVAAAEFVDGATDSVLRLTLGSGVLAVAAAASPLVATLLVGYAYMQRGIRRRREALARRAAVPAAPPPAARGEGRGEPGARAPP